MKVVLASGNRGKIRELKALLADLEIEVLSLHDFPEIGEIVEDGLTFRDNAVKKASAVTDVTGLVVVADDSGLEVDCLAGVPGVHSARFAGEGKSDLDNNRKLLSLMEGVPEEKRTARFRCVIAISTPCGELYTVEGTCEGRISRAMKGEQGFGYDPLFYLPEYGRTFAELDPAVKNEISHRGRALALAKVILAGIIERVEMERCGLG